ncbi:MAG TPA: hypothetical protein VG370_08495 [Chloroflexota bacterium]|nr:hypothetical protein [Chloroflexota bacterium]
MTPTRLPAGAVTAWRVGLLLWAVYLCSYGGGPHSPDEIGQLATTASLIRRGSFDADEIFWTIPAAGGRSDAQVEIGPTGDVWSVRGPTVPLVMAPWYALAFAWPALDATFATLLSSSLVSAATGGLLVLLGRRLGLSPRAAAAGGLLYGLATMAWPYSRLGFGEPAIALMVVLAALLGPLGAGGAAAAGLAVAAAAGAKWSAAALAVPIGLYLALPHRAPGTPPSLGRGTGYPLEGGPGRGAARCRGEPAGAARRGLAFGGATLLGLAPLAWHNLARYGSPLLTGYELAGREQFSTAPLFGLLGLTVSPYRGVLWFVPLVGAALLLAPAAARRAPGFVALALGVVVVTVATFAGWRMWWGGNAWGPRFLLPAMPLLTLLVPLAWPRLGRRARAGVAGLAALSALIQLPGVALDFNPWEKALRGPLPDFPRAGSLWDPRTAQIVGHLRRLRDEWPCALDLAWVRCGAVDWTLLAALALALALATGALLRRRRWLDRLAGGAVLAALAALLVRGPVPPAGAMAELLTAASARDRAARPTDGTVVLASPEVPVLWGRDRSRGARYGLNRDDLPRDGEAERLLSLALERHPRLWLLAANVPRDEPLNGVERWLTRNAFPVEERLFGAARLRLFLTGAGPDERSSESPLARFADARAALIATRLLDERVSMGDPARLELVWWLDGADARDLSVFVHLYAAGRLVGQADAALVDALPEGADPAGYRGTARGRHALRPSEPVSGPASVEVGLYRRAGERLAATGSGGIRLPDDRVPAGQLRATGE